MSSQTGADVLLRLDLNNGGSGNNTLCNGTGVINANGSGGLKHSLPISSNSFLDYVFNYYSLTAAQSYLMVAAIPPAGSVFQTILIRKITIEETPPAVSFNITPASVPITCGSITPVTFTINNGGGTTGITGYTWSLGTTPNGWELPNGTAAPATYSTGLTNTLTLTPVCGSAPKNVSATVTANGNNYNTNASTVSITQPTLSINGSAAICSGSSSYSVNSLPCNASVVWSIIPATGTANLSCSSCTTTSLSYVNSGTVTLTATISNVCGGTITVTKNIILGSVSIAGTFINTFDGNTYPLGYYPDITNAACTGYIINTNIQLPGATSFTWTKVSSTGVVNYTQNGNNISFYLFAANQYVLFKLDATNGCSSISKQFKWLSSNCSDGGNCNGFTVSPNPATNSLTVIVPDIPPPCDIVTSGDSKTASVKRSISEIKIYDNAGNLRKTQKENKTNQATLNLTGFKSGIYIVEIIDGSYKERQQIIIQK